VERLDAEAESDANTAGGAAIVGVAGAVDKTEITAVARKRRTLPPVVSGATLVLHLRVTCLVICVLRSFSRNGVGGGTKASMKSEEGCPLRTALAGYLLK